MNLTDRQVELIEDLLCTYSAYRYYFEKDFGDRGTKDFIFKDNIYIVLERDYDKVCEIIDYIKGVKK